MEFVKLLLQLIILIFPFIFKKDNFYDERVKKVNALLKKKRKNFARMNEDERSIELSNLFDDIKRIVELR